MKHFPGELQHIAGMSDQNARQALDRRSGLVHTKLYANLSLVPRSQVLSTNVGKVLRAEALDSLPKKIPYNLDLSPARYSHGLGQFEARLYFRNEPLKTRDLRRPKGSKGEAGCRIQPLETARLDCLRAHHHGVLKNRWRLKPSRGPFFCQSPGCRTEEGIATI